jgi:Putative peptidoglycan binding domain
MPVLSNPHAVNSGAPSESASASAQAPGGVAVPPDGDGEPAARSRRRWPWAVGAVVVLACAAGAVVLLDGDDSIEPVETVNMDVATAEVRDLIEFTELDGRMVYDDVTSVPAGIDGVLTELVADGAEVERGDVVYAVNAQPVTVFYGDVPLFRPLSVDAVGDDVRLLEANLASLGYHTDGDDEFVDTGFSVDGVFDDATADAVVRWQQDVGSPDTGVVNPTDVVVIDGPSTVSDLPTDLGSTVTIATPVLELKGGGTVETAYIANGGEIELFVAAGQELASGDLVYAADGLPVTALVTDADIDRDLREGIEAGEDVRALEEMLVALGYDADGDLVVDDEFDEATGLAVTNWQDDLENTFEDVEVDGEVAVDEFVVYEPGTVVGSLSVADGEILPSGSELWTHSTDSATWVVETQVTVADQDQLVEGATVDVELPDGEIVEGTVTKVATSSMTDPMVPDGDPTIAVAIEVTDVPASISGLNEVDVEVKLVDQIATGVTVVPASSLIATADGGFAVEALTTAGTTIVAVDPGMFNDGWVEVTGVQPGTQVVVP